MEVPHPTEPSHSTALISGAVAGTAVDLILFPLDTIKTRLQSKNGFRQSGGFTRIYSGIASSVVGSAPNAALFFVSYESCKKLMKPYIKNDSISQMLSASIGEIIACSVRVPVEVVKQRTQAKGNSSWFNLVKTVRVDGFRGLYRGYGTTISREIPFSLIQFPLWEYLKLQLIDESKSHPEPWKSTLCGAISGGLSAFLTTPLDVAKTRVILAEKDSKMSKVNVIGALKLIWNEKGVKGLFAGTVPRVLWISLGGAIFLGGYDQTVRLLERNLETI